MEELEIYLVDGERVNVSNWPEQYKILWLSNNLNAKRVDAKEDEIPVDKSIFGTPDLSPVLPDTNAGYQDFNLTNIIKNLYSDEVQAFDIKNPPVQDDKMLDVPFELLTIPDPENTEFNKMFSDISDKDKPSVKSAIINAAVNPNYPDKTERTGLPGEIMYEGLGLSTGDRNEYELEMYSQQDVSRFMKQPSIQRALELGFITKKDLAMGMYPGYTAWVETMGDQIDESPSGITLPDGTELTNREVYKIMWKNDMPYDSEIEKLKRKARNRVNKFVLQDAGQIETIIDLERLNQPYIFEDYAVEDSFVNDVFNEAALQEDINFNIKDFNGFLNSKGYRENLEKNLLKLNEIGGENAAKQIELLKLDHLNYYINEQITRDLLQQKLMWEKANPGRDADTEGIQFYISDGNINPSNIKKWMKTETPYVYNQLEKNQLELEEEYQNLISTGGNVSTGDFLQRVSSNAWLGFWNDAIVPFFTNAVDFVPGETTDNIAESMRRHTLIQRFERGDNLRYAYKTGMAKEFPEYGGIRYLVTKDGRIFDDTNKLEATAFLTPQQQRNIIDKAREEGKKGSSSSSVGLAFESSRVIGDLFFQVGLTWGVGKIRGVASAKITQVEKARRLEKSIGGYSKGMGVLGKTREALRLIPIKKPIADAMIAQGTIGLTRGYEETLLAARSAGINEEEARQLASNASLQTGVWYTLTAPISPQTKAKDLLFGKIPKQTAQTAVDIFKREGWKGWANYWKNIKTNISTIDGIKQTGKSGIRTLDMMQREGWKELFQENIQQVGETTGIGAQTNRLAGQQIVKQDYTLQDFIHTSQLSFIAGFLMPGGGKVLNSSRTFARDYMGMDNVDRFNALAYMAFNKKDVKDLLAKQVDEGNYTQDEVDNLLGEIDQFANTVNHLPSDIDAKNAKTVLDALAELNTLENEKKDKPNGLYDYDARIKKLRERINNAYYDAATGDTRAAIMAAAKAGVAGNTIYKALENEQEALAYLSRVIERDEDTKDLTEREFNNYLKKRFFDKAGGAMFVQNGIKHALEFKWKAAMAPRGTAADQTASHEFKHALWVETIKDDPETQKLLGKALFLELGKMDLALDDDTDDSIIPARFRERWRKYMAKVEDKIAVEKELRKYGESSKQDYDRAVDKILGNLWEEGMMLYSEAVGNKWVSYDEDVADRLKNTWRRAMQFIGASDFEFDSGKAVFNMIRDYNAAVKSGTLRFNIAFKRMGRKGAKVDKKKLKQELADENLKQRIKEKTKRRQKKSEEENEKARKMLEEMMAKKKKASERKSKTRGSKNIEDEKRFDDKFSLLPSQTPESFKDKINQYYSPEKFSTELGLNEAAYAIALDYERIIAEKIWVQYGNLPQIDIDMITQDAMIELVNHIKNFNKDFLKERQKYKDSLEKQGLSKAEIKKRLETQDEQGYKVTTGKNKGQIVKENPDLNAWINVQLNNKIKSALKLPGRTGKKFTEQIDENVTQGVQDDDTAKQKQLEFEEEQSKLVALLEDPVFGFVNEAGEDIIIDTVPWGGLYISDANDPLAAVNRRLATETDPNVIQDLQRQKRNLERGLELEAKGVENLTKEEFQELKDLKDFSAFMLGAQKNIKTYEALILPQSAAQVIIDEVRKKILKAPNIESLEILAFKKQFENFIFPLARKMTFKNRGDLTQFMYENWKTIYDVINNPYDPVTGKSTYAVKKMPPILKAFDEDGNRIKKKDITRAVFLQAFFGRDGAEKIIRKYNKRPNKELKELLPAERHPKGSRFEGQLIGTKEDGSISYAFEDRRTSLMELFGDVIVLQEARRLLRNELFIEDLAKVNPELAGDLNNEKTMSEILNDLATGKTTSVKFSLNDDLNPWFKGRSIDQQIVIANVVEKAKLNTIIRSKNQEIKNSLVFEVPNLENLNDEAIGLYLINKISEGYNNFKFLNKQNTKGKITKSVLKAGDVKFSMDPDFNFETYSKELSKGFNEILSETGKIDPNKIISRAQVTGKGSMGSDVGKWWHYGGMYNAADADFEGLMRMIASGKGKKGEQQLEWLEENLIKVYDEGNMNLRHERANNLSNWNELSKKNPDMLKKLNEPVPGMEGFLIDDAIRVFMWSRNWAPGNKQLPGISPEQKFKLISFVTKNPKYLKFARELMRLSKQTNGWIEPYEHWKSYNIQSEIMNNMIEASRPKFLAKFIQNKDLIFSEENLNKVQAIYGKSMRESLENILYRMQHGKNKENADKPFGALMNYLNNSIGVTMFLNMRSAMLQSISMLNYINMSDNNPLMQGMAMMNATQYLKDFIDLWGSGYLRDRRAGMLTNIQEQEIVALANSRNFDNLVDQFNAINAALLKWGFAPTRLMDSFAIAFGGAGFYRNRINTYLKDGYSQKEAQEKAYFDWYRTSEKVQQSGDPSRISMNQASNAGRLIMSFQNTPLQYGRVVKAAAVDLVKRRGSDAENLSKIAYYGGISYAIFSILQNALAFSLFGWDDEEELNPQKYAKGWERHQRGYIDNLLKSQGLVGNFMAYIIRVGTKADDLWNDPKAMYKEADLLLTMTEIFTPVNIKYRTGLKAWREAYWNKNELKWAYRKDGWGGVLTSPHFVKTALYSAESATGAPFARWMQKYENLENMITLDLELWQRFLLFSGFSTWNLGIEDGNQRRGRSNELDFGGSGLNFNTDFNFNPNIKF